MSGNEHIPVGVLVADIETNELQALSDEYPDELRSASHACRNALDDNDTSLQINFRRERVLERASALSSCPLLSIRKAQLVRSTPFGSRGHGCMRTIRETLAESPVGERSISGTGPSHNGLIQAGHCHTYGQCPASIRTSGLHRVQEMERSPTPTCAAVTLLIIK